MTDTTRSSHPALSMTDNVAMSTEDFLLLAGRILLAWIFLRSGWGKIGDIAGYSAGFPARGLQPWMAWIAVPFEFLGAIALIFGFATRYVLIGFVIYMLVATFSSHAYWTYTDVAQRRIQDSAFWKNISMLGGILILFASGPGKFSLDRWLAKR
jgi:putative oxidoreductase